jgi:hypothetical protein
MTLNTNLRGRLRNTDLPLSSGLFPLFEAVVNSIHSIEDAGKTSTGKIVVNVIRGSQKSIEFSDDDKVEDVIVGFKIVDSGIGFDESNMASFETLDSEHKASRGGRGVGRLLWLKAFNAVHVESTFKSDKRGKQRLNFTFNAASGIIKKKVEAVASNAKYQTSVHLEGFQAKYQKANYKTCAAIANALLEHCLWYFVRSGGVPKIVIADGQEVIDLDDLFESYMVESAKTESVEIKGQKFELTHTKLQAASSRNHAIALCAASRLVKEENITGKVPGLFGRLKDREKEFAYVCYVSSPFLDERVRSERTAFDISENHRSLFEDQDISLGEIREVVIQKASQYLKKYLSENITRATARVKSFVSQRAPRYQPIMPRISLGQMAIDPNASNKDLDLTLHKELAQLESKLIEEGHELMKPNVEEEGYEE